MRRFAPILVIAAIGLLSPSQLQASTLTMGTSTESYAAAPSKSHWGHCHRKSRVYAAAGETHVESVWYPCQPDQPMFDGGGHRSSPVARHMNSLKRRIHHEPPHCAQCYATGIMCTCCDHTEKVLRPGTPRYIFYAVLIRTHMIVTY